MKVLRNIFFWAFVLLLTVPAPMPAYADDVFLPMVTTGQTQLPLCTPEFVAAAEQLPADVIARGEIPSCQALGEWYEITEPARLPVADGEAKAADVFMPRKYSLYQTLCSTCSSTDGVSGISASLTAQEPSLPGGYSWNDFWYSNYIALGSGAGQVSCQNSALAHPRLIIGIGKGKLTNNTALTVPTLYFEVLKSGYCYGFTSYNTIAPQAGLRVEIWREGSNSGWTARAKIGNTWQNFVTNEAMGYTPTASLISYGQEIGATGNNHSVMSVPLNAASKVNVRPYAQTYKPYYETYLPAGMLGKTSLITSSPLKSLGVITGGPDYTSRASTTQ